MKLNVPFDSQDKDHFGWKGGRSRASRRALEVNIGFLGLSVILDEFLRIDERSLFLLFAQLLVLFSSGEYLFLEVVGGVSLLENVLGNHSTG